MLITGAYYYKPPEDIPTEEHYYTLREYNGRIAVFSDGKDVPDEILDVRSSMFPEKDKNDLKAGITVFSKEELFRLIEDFS